MKPENATIKNRKIYTFINVGLICFLLFIATIGMRGLTSSSFGNETEERKSGFTKDKIMVCAIGQCLFI